VHRVGYARITGAQRATAERDVERIAEIKSCQRLFERTTGDRVVATAEATLRRYRS